MKGIIFNLLEQVVSREYGADGWDSLLENAGVPGAYTSLGSYSDVELMKLVRAAADRMKVSTDEALRWFGVRAFALLAEAYPQFIKGHKSCRTLLTTLNSVIHHEVRKLYPGAEVPDFQFDTSSADVLVVRYRSARKLCSFAEGLMEGAAANFGEEAALEHVQCMKRSEAYCQWNVRFKVATASP